MTSPQSPSGQPQPGQPTPGGQQPPPVPNPYGPSPQPGYAVEPYAPGQHPQSHDQQSPPPDGYPQAGSQSPAGAGTGQYGAGGGWGPYPPPRKRQRDSEPGKFTWWDLGATLFYVFGFLSGLVGLIGLLPPVAEILNSDDGATVEFGLFLINAISYGVLALIAVVLCGKALWRSIRRFAYLWWLKLLLIPVGWFMMMVLNVVFVLFALGAEPETSANQEAITAMLDAVPFLGAVVVLAVLGPLVEEYFFRHLLVGKLSRYLNVWICGAISVATFPLLHFIPALLGASDDLSLVSVVPYVTMGILITVGYIVAGRNLFYAWLIHAFNNFASLLVAYFVQPWADGVMDEFENIESGLAALSLLATMIG